MYTTNRTESFNSKFRKVTDGKRIFSSDQSLLKSLYLATVMDLEKKWSREAVRDWSIIYGQLPEIFGERLEV